MSHKLLPRLGSAIASTILSLAAVSLVGVDKAQAAVLTYNFSAGGSGRGDKLNYFKVDNTSLTKTGEESIAVSEGRLYSLTVAKEYYDLAGVSALFYQGELRGLYASDQEYVTSELIIPPGEPFGPLYIEWRTSVNWSIYTYPTYLSTSNPSVLNGYREQYRTINGGTTNLTSRSIYSDNPVSYTLVDTAAAEPVPEPLTVGTAAVALAGLSWLKHMKKMAG